MNKGILKCAKFGTTKITYIFSGILWAISPYGLGHGVLQSKALHIQSLGNLYCLSSNKTQATNSTMTSISCPPKHLSIQSHYKVNKLRLQEHSSTKEGSICDTWYIFRS